MAIAIPTAFRTLLNRLADDADGLTPSDTDQLAESACKTVSKSSKPTALADSLTKAFSAKNPGAANLDVFEFSVKQQCVTTRRANLIREQLQKYFHKNADRLPLVLKEVDPTSFAVVDQDMDAYYLAFSYKNGTFGLHGDAASKKMQTLLTGTLRSDIVGYLSPAYLSEDDASQFAIQIKDRLTYDGPSGTPPAKRINKPAHLEGAASFEVPGFVDRKVTGFALGNPIGEQLIAKVEHGKQTFWYDCSTSAQ